ncbi:MAG TPA: DUF4363 family protein [Bacillales bacterium]
MKQLVAGLMITLLVVGGWSHSADAQAGKAFFQQIDQIREYADQGNWQKANQAATNLQRLYQKKEWKLQLIGDEAEYEGVNQELDKLKAAIAAKDETQVKLELSTIGALLKSIYSL